jgi:hypothetical protein
MSDMSHLCGWHDDPAEVERIMQTLPMPFIVCDDIKDSGKGKTRLLYEYFEKVAGFKYKCLTQTIGDCVSHGSACCIDMLKCVQSLLKGTGEEFVNYTATEVIYALSRVEIAGGQLGGGDGSNGIWACQANQKFGTVVRAKYGGIDLTVYSGQRAREWGAPRRGCPDELEKVAKDHTLKTFSQVRTWEEARDAIYNGYPISIASNQGFTSSRDKDGFARASGNWAHQMALIAMKDDERPGVLIQNSWGCYSEDTEILTNNGWKLFKNLSKFDMVATLNKNGHLEFQFPEEYQKYNVDTELIEFSGRNIDLLVTENHNMYCQKYNQYNREIPFERLRADTIFDKNGRAKYKMKKNCKGVNNGHVLYHTIGDIKIKMDDWLEFLGYFISEGHTTKTTSLRKKHKLLTLTDGSIKKIYVDGQIPQTSYITGISQKKSDTKQKMLDCLRRLPFKFCVTKNGFSCNNKKLYEILSNLGKCDEKFIPDYVWDCSKDQLNILYVALMNGDGSRCNGKITYYSSSEKLANDFQRLLLSIGYSGDIRVVDRIDTVTTSGNNRNLIEYHVRIKEKSNETMPAGGWYLNKVKYQGYVYCVTVPNHVIYVRRNGNAVWCGNSNWIGGPKGKYDIPDGSFWCDAEVLERNILRAGDSWAHSSFDGFPPQKLDLECF